MADIRDENGRKERLYLFYDGESVSGKVNIIIGLYHPVVRKTINCAMSPMGSIT